MDVSDVVGADRPDYLARSMAIHPPGKRVEVHIYASERKGEIDDERVIAVMVSPLRMEFFHRHASDGLRMYWQTPVDSVKQ